MLLLLIFCVDRRFTAVARVDSDSVLARCDIVVIAPCPTGQTIDVHVVAVISPLEDHFPHRLHLLIIVLTTLLMMMVLQSSIIARRFIRHPALAAALRASSPTILTYRLLGRKRFFFAPNRRIDVAGQTAVQMRRLLLVCCVFGGGAAACNLLVVALRVVVETFTSVVLRLHQRVIVDQVVLVGKLRVLRVCQLTLSLLEHSWHGGWQAARNGAAHLVASTAVMVEHLADLHLVEYFGSADKGYVIARMELSLIVSHAQSMLVLLMLNMARAVIVEE